MDSPEVAAVPRKVALFGPARMILGQTRDVRILCPICALGPPVATEIN